VGATHILFYRSFGPPAWLLLVAVGVAWGCGGKVAVDLDAGTGGTAGGGGSGTTSASGGEGGANGGFCGPASKGPGEGQFQLPECFPKPASGCPKQYDAPLFIVPTQPCVYLVSVDCGPFTAGEACCYGVTEEVKPCTK
jgi:hypothetical protein